MRTDHRSLWLPFGRVDRTGLTQQIQIREENRNGLPDQQSRRKSDVAAPVALEEEEEKTRTIDFIGYKSEENDKGAISLVTATRAKI